MLALTNSSVTNDWAFSLVAVARGRALQGWQLVKSENVKIHGKSWNIMWNSQPAKPKLLLLYYHMDSNHCRNILLSTSWIYLYKQNREVGGYCRH